ncbi:MULTISPECIES: IclR family transcriptional regulator [Peribacillus]|uniref:IclR family transcriptional regulator n=1 Tax=Peribacillus TaxID=2675229 RepID=UPI001F4F0521|nr:MULTISPECIES: IclR family transcriptional regulator [unclassified Peribacillus]MCK1983590.1 IclR family transcriptional regulator [Peribacillus sp. Aquil_B1]MCK2006608.1 IclR family transcriptional regulator [Peribacillus sp. Aquil_B8]
MSSLQKMLRILDLFTIDQQVISLDNIVDKLNISIPTAYRYIKELIDAGLLAKVESGEYILGPKIIKLDRFLRSSDPIINKGKRYMHELAELTGLVVLLSNIYNDEIINIYTIPSAGRKINIKYDRGTPQPLFRGSTSRIIVANLPRNRLIRLYNEHNSHIEEIGIGSSWQQFYSYFSKIKREGYSLSHGELDDDISGIAAPIFFGSQIIGSLTIALNTSQIEIFNMDKMISLLIEAADKISKDISNNIEIEENKNT